MSYSPTPIENIEIQEIPNLKITKLGIISRNYNFEFGKHSYDYSSILTDALLILDNEACDAALFSLFSIEHAKWRTIPNALKDLKHIKVVMLEEFTSIENTNNEPEWKKGKFSVFYKIHGQWHEYILQQQFGKLAEMNPDFASRELPKRMLGNFCVLLCGESNGVNYSKEHKLVEDKFHLRESIPRDVGIILNPVHDKMMRFEMPLKRKFLSENGRWTVSVWNKGKARDGRKPAWSVFHDGQEIVISPIANDLDIEIGIVEF